MSKFLTLSAVAASVILAGCASTDLALPGKTKAPVDLSSVLDGKRMILAKREKPAFTAVTGGKAALGMLGGGAMGVAGNRIVKRNNVQDPAGRIAQNVASAVSSRHRVNVVGAGSHSVDKLSVAEIASAHSDADLVLDIRTKGWGFTYFPTDWKHYRVTYNAKMRLIDTATRTVVHKANCNRMPKRTGTEPTRKQLLANNAALLKQKLDEQASICAEKFKKKLMNL